MYGVSKEITPCKGKRLGNCNRTACQSPDYVVFWNRATQAYYCPNCARLIMQHMSKEDKESIFPDFEKNAEEHRAMRRSRNFKL